MPESLSGSMVWWWSYTHSCMLCMLSLSSNKSSGYGKYNNVLTNLTYLFYLLLLVFSFCASFTVLFVTTHVSGNTVTDISFALKLWVRISYTEHALLSYVTLPDASNSCAVCCAVFSY